MLVATSDQLNFTIRNSRVNEQASDTLPGIGLENTRKRLDLIYEHNGEGGISAPQSIFVLLVSCVGAWSQKKM